MLAAAAVLRSRLQLQASPPSPTAAMMNAAYRIEELLPELSNISVQQPQKSANAVGQDRLHQV